MRISKSASIPRAPLENSNAIATERIGSPRDLEEDVIEDDDQVRIQVVRGVITVVLIGNLRTRKP